MSLPWTVKYQPYVISDFVDNSDALNQLEKWLQSWDEKPPAKKGALLYGPPGVGKTSVVYVLAKELGYDTVEMNASDLRTGKTVERIIGGATSQSTLFGQSKRIVILDELEGISGTEDREGLSTLTEIVRKSLSPLILIAADAWSTKLRELRNQCTVIEFKRIPTRDTVSRLRKICQSEGIIAEDKALQLIAERAGGDLRSAIIDLQALSNGKNQLKCADVGWLSPRDRTETIFNVLKNIFNSNNCISARRAAEVSDVDFEMLFEWIYENAPYQLTDRQDLVEAMDALARADLYFHRIRAEQNWELLPYALDLMTAGVAMSRKRTKPAWVSFKFPQKISFMSKSKDYRRTVSQIGRKIGEKCHISVSEAKNEYLPYLKIIFSNDHGRFSSNIAEVLGLDTDEIDFLKTSS